MAGHPIMTAPAFTPALASGYARDLSMRYPGWVIAAGVPVAHRRGTFLVARDWDDLEARLARHARQAGRP
jgi:hypothetical protein